MVRTLRLCCAVLSGHAALQVCAQPAYDRFQIADRTYIRTEHRLTDLPAFPVFRSCVSGEEFVVAYQVTVEEPLPPKDIFVRRYDRWGRVSLPETYVDTAEISQASMDVGAVGSHIWIVWSDAAGNWMRRVSWNGVVDPDPQLLDDQTNPAWALRVSSNGQRVAVTFEPDEGASVAGAFVRIFDPFGAPQTSLTELNAPEQPNQAYGYLSSAVADDGRILTAFGQWFPLAQRHSEVRAIASDLTFGPPISTGSPGELLPDVALLNDGGFLVRSTGFTVVSSAHVQWFDANGIATGPAIAVDYRASGFGALPDNGFAQFFSARAAWQTELTVQIHDSAGAPIAPPALLARDAEPVRTTTSSGSRTTRGGAMWALSQGLYSGHPVYFINNLQPYVPGDLNADGVLNNFDIDPFVLALVNRDAYAAMFPTIPAEVIDILGDLDGDGRLTNFDIDPFVAALVGAPPS